MLKSQEIFLKYNIEKRMSKIHLFTNSKSELLKEHIINNFEDENHIKCWMKEKSKKRNKVLNFDRCFVYICPINDMYYYEFNFKNQTKMYYTTIYNINVETENKKVIIDKLLKDYLLSDITVEEIVEWHTKLNFKEKISTF
jgi:hypothetical protein